MRWKASGYMPPKGGRIDLSDEEVASAVDFMIDESS
jgi:cytochrome c5